MDDDGIGSSLPVATTGVQLHKHKGTSLVGVNICDGDLIMYNKNIINAGDGIYVFAMSNQEYCRYIKFVSESEVAIFNLPHTAKLDDAQSEYELMHISRLQLKGKIFATIRNYK